MSSAFISYAHGDQEFVLSLAERLQAGGLDVQFGQIVLRIGDSLVERISEAIAEGDFLIAVVSPDSVQSEWCRKELALAMTQGINQRRVKVLPIRYRAAPMPPGLADTYWADSGADVSMVAEKLLIAMEAQLKGDGPVASEVAEGRGDAPPPEGQGGRTDVLVAIDTMAERLFDVLQRWDGVHQGTQLLDELTDRQRRLRYAIDALPRDVRDGLPLTIEVAEAGWNEYLGMKYAAEVEPDLREELKAVRTAVAQGIPVSQRWVIAADRGQVGAGNRDANAYLWEIGRANDTRRIKIFISDTALEVSDAGFPDEVVRAKETAGRSVVTSLLGLDEPPPQVLVATYGVSWPLD
jgi:hypothetical protein